MYLTIVDVTIEEFPISAIKELLSYQQFDKRFSLNC